MSTRASFDVLFKQGKEALTQGDLNKAVASFKAAREALDPTGEGRITNAKVEQQLGICYRLKSQRVRRTTEQAIFLAACKIVAAICRVVFGWPFRPVDEVSERRAKYHKLSHEAFTKALQYAEGQIHYACILRDHAMVYYAAGNVTKALQLLEDSADALTRLSETLPKGGKERQTCELELAVSHSFETDLLLRSGRSNREECESSLADSHNIITSNKHDLYELNSGIRYMRAARFGMRRMLARRMIELSAFNPSTRNSKRLVQVIGLLVFGRHFDRIVNA